MYGFGEYQAGGKVLILICNNNQDDATAIGGMVSYSWLCALIILCFFQRKQN